MVIEFKGNLISINRLPFEQVRSRFPKKLVEESDLETVEFDSKIFDDFSDWTLGLFWAPERISFRDRAWEMQHSHYLQAHEQLHEFDHVIHRAGFGRLGDIIPEAELDEIYFQFYNAFGDGDARTRKIEGAATAFGLYYGTRPWALKLHYPDTFDIIHEFHQDLGGYPIDHPEYKIHNRIYRYQPGTEPYYGSLLVSNLYKASGWAHVTVIRTSGEEPRAWHWNEFIKQDVLLNDRLDKQGRNVRLQDGDLIFRTVPAEWINEQKYQQTPAASETSAGERLVETVVDRK